MTESDPVPVSRWLADDVKAEDVKFKCKRGDKCVVEVTGMEKNNGQLSVQGIVDIIA